MGIDLKDADSVQTAPLVALGLVGGFVLAQQTGIRPLGGVVMAATGIAAGRGWLAKGGPGLVAVLTATYVGAMAVSHPLAKRIGVWPSVGLVTAAAAGAAYVLSDRH